MLESYDNLFLRGEDTKYDADVLAEQTLLKEEVS